MKLTKAQSKRLRYICGVVDYNQPCTRKYTGGPKGKVRHIGKFTYFEQGDELTYFEYDGNVAPLSNYEAEEFLSALMDDSGFHLGGCIRVEGLPSADTGNHNDIVNAVAGAVEHQVQIDVPPKNEIPEVNVPVEAQPPSDGWMDADGNDPEGISAGIADIPQMAEKEAASEATGNVAVREPNEDELREITMTAAALEASRICGVISGNLGDTSVDIIRRNATVPNFLNTYGECLKKAGSPLTLAELAAALPAQRNWIFKEGVIQ